MSSPLPMSHGPGPSRASDGRLRLPPWLLAAVAILTSFSLARFYQRRPPVVDRGSVGSTAAVLEDPASLAVPALRGELRLGSGSRLVIRIVPYGVDGAREDLRSEELARQFGLGPGRLHRAVLVVEQDPSAPEGGGAAQDVDAAPDFVARIHQRCSVELGDGEVALRDLGSLLDSTPGSDLRSENPLIRLLVGEASGEADRDANPWQIPLWGTMPEAGEVDCAVTLGDGVFHLPLERTTVGPNELPRSFRTRAAAGGRATPASRRIAELEARGRELEDKLHTERLSHLAFVEGVARLESAAGIVAGVAASDSPQEAQPPAPEVVADPRVEEVTAALRALLKVTGHRSLDLLHAGALEGGGLGPVLFRLLSERGGLVGTIAAERLHMEASRAARTLTIVLEDGYESRGGERVRFQGPGGGVRRITMDIDPSDFVTRVPELFSPEDLRPVEDDGVWDLGALRVTLNRLLLEDARSGWYRVHSFAGVIGDELIAVHLKEYDASGQLERRIFTDRMRIQIDSEEVRLLLRGGGITRGTETTPFRDGRYVIHLPRATLGPWRGAAIPREASPGRGARSEVSRGDETEAGGPDPAEGDGER